MHRKDISPLTIQPLKYECRVVQWVSAFCLASQERRPILVKAISTNVFGRFKNHSSETWQRLSLPQVLERSSFMWVATGLGEIKWDFNKSIAKGG